jgi:hypothetical protein
MEIFLIINMSSYLLYFSDKYTSLLQQIFFFSNLGFELLCTIIRHAKTGAVPVTVS